MERSPLLSVVIPTFGRPEFLTRAIDSALQAVVNNSEVEVIVVPNGKDDSWREIAEIYSNTKQVRFIYCEIPHGNAARNVGLKSARGHYVRFLDDDDYLYPLEARAQLQAIISSDADICSGKVDIVDENGRNYGLCSFPIEDDFVDANILISGITLPISNIYSRKMLKVYWDEKISRVQDYIFIVDIMIQGEVKWKKYEGVVGCWYQHNQGRVSLSNGQLNKSVEIPVWVFDRILKLYFTLYENNRLTLSRKRKISTALWNFISNYYYKNPVICHELVNKIYENGLDSYNEMGVRLQKNYFFKLCIHRYPLLYIKVKDFFMKVFPSRGIESFVRKL